MDEIKVEGNKVSIRGSHAALAAAIAGKKLDTRTPMKGKVPSFGLV